MPADYADDVPTTLARLSVTFDRKMKDGCWAWVQRFKDKYPQTTGKPSYDADFTTCSVPVKLEAGKVYWLEINSPPFTSFQSTGGIQAQQHVMLFATKSADGKPTPIPADLLARAKAVNESAGRLAPAVVRTAPAAFADDVPPTLARLSVTFDQKMKDGCWSWVQRFKDKYPQTTGKPSFDANGTTCSLLVKLEPGKVYWLEINSPPFASFQSAGGTKARQHVMLFATRSADGKPTPIPADLLAKAKEINASAESQPAVVGRKVDKVPASLPEKAAATMMDSPKP
jgi:hypothetical protein